MARQYTDRTGVVHTLEIHLGTRNRLKQRFGLDLVAASLDITHMAKIVEAIGGPETVFELLEVVEGIPAEQLMEAANGQTLKDAQDALTEAIIDFFPPSDPLTLPIRQTVGAVKGQQSILIGMIRDNLLDQINSPDFLKDRLQLLTLTNGSGESPGPLDTALQNGSP